MTNVGSSVGEPNKDYFVRINPNDTQLVGPLTFAQANAHARFLSREESNTFGTAEVITSVGTRGGDPIQETPVLFVKFLYIRGRLTLGGRAAEFNSKKFIGVL